jgi:hypothetical protein
VHLTLTDHLTCPRCGPGAGLILFMERAEARRVVAGALGCPVCRTQYPIASRVADLRAGGAGPGRAEAGAWAREHGGVDALRIAALLELGEGRGFVLVDGPGALAVGAQLPALVADVEPVIAVGAGEVAGAGRVEASALLDSGVLPLGDRTMRGVAWVGGTPDAARLAELVRVCRPTGRVVIETAGTGGDLDGVAGLLESAGARVRARDASALVAVVL